MPASPPRQVNVQDAKTHLSALLLRVEAGEEIVLARNGRPCARLVPMEPQPQRRLGFLKGTVEESFFAPLPESELQAWEN
jgi:prevent-host-death family protein